MRSAGVRASALAETWWRKNRTGGEFRNPVAREAAQRIWNAWFDAGGAMV